jgi:hypothetical protein
MSNSDLRDRVLELEPYPEDLKATIREKIGHTKERPLKSWERSLMVLVCVALGLFVVGGMIGLVMVFDKFRQSPPYVFAYIMVGIPMVVLLLCYTIAMLLINLKRNTVRPRMEFLLVHAAFGLCIYMTVAAMFTERGVDGADLAGLVAVGVCVVVARIEIAYLRLREQALRNELAIVELSERIAAGEAQGKE